MAIVVTLCVFLLVRAGGAGSGQAPTSSLPGFVGAHARPASPPQMYETWQSGRHSKMLQPATASSVVGDFSKSSVTLHGNRFQLRTANGEFYIAESYLTGKLQEHRVEHTLGSRRIQHYLTTIDKGWIVVLPPSWDVQRREWFDNMDIVRPGRTAGTPIQQWNKDCVGCHVSGEEKTFRQASQDYRTRWTDFGTSCERCHGPGSTHVEAYSRAPVARPAGERSIVKPTRLDPQTSSMICAQCHSLRNVVHPGYKAGDDYFDFFTPRLEYDPGSDRELPYWPDGRPRRFSNDAIGLWQSACFLRGGATCTTCHRDPHLPNVDRSPQLAPANNALCTQCHDAIGRQLTSHTRHAADSAGSSCVECHMPKTVISLNSTMRDHTLSLPTPENTVALSIPNACNECHTEKTPVWAVNVLNAWYPNGRRARLVRQAEAFTAARSKRPEGLDRLLALASDDSVPPLIRATAVGYLRNYSDERGRQALLVAAKAEQPAVRVAAISSLGYQPALVDNVVRSVLVAALDDPRRAIRIAALVSLINVNVSGNPLGTVDVERLRRVGHEYAELSSLYEDDAGFDRDLGVVHLLTGEFDRAADVLQVCLGLEPNRPSARFLLAFARLGQRRIDDARALLKQVQPSDPMYEAAQRRLKSLPPGSQ